MDWIKIVPLTKNQMINFEIKRSSFSNLDDSKYFPFRPTAYHQFFPLVRSLQDKDFGQLLLKKVVSSDGEKYFSYL